MKQGKSRSIKTKIRTAIILLSIFGTSSAAEPVIVIPETPSALVFPPGETVRYAAEFLQRHIKAATGKSPEIIPESRAEHHSERIWIGNTRFAMKNLKGIAFRPEELLIRSMGSDLILCGEITPGGIDRGTLFAVYEYLEQALGWERKFPKKNICSSLAGISGNSPAAVSGKAE